VGMKFGRVAVGIAAGGDVGIRFGIGVGGANRVKGSTNSSTIMAAKTMTTNPANTLITSTCERVKLSFSLHLIPLHFTLKIQLRKARKIYLNLFVFCKEE
jgi:hypothetical protein